MSFQPDFLIRLAANSYDTNQLYNVLPKLIFLFMEETKNKISTWIKWRSSDDSESKSSDEDIYNLSIESNVYSDNSRVSDEPDDPIMDALILQFSRLSLND